MAGADLDALFARHRRDAVLLHRPYPPQAGAPMNSRLGGLPTLPAHHDWPRTGKGKPLHFLAQIDCAEIPFASPLPDRGVLFFFGRDDAEQLWGEGEPTDDCRVLFIRDAFAATPPRLAPGDLPPIGDEYASRGSRDFLLPGEAGPAVHNAWPVRLTRIDSWPDQHPDSDEPPPEGWRATLLDLLRSPKPTPTWHEFEAQQEEYRDRLAARQADAFAAATGGRPAYKPYDEEPNPEGKATQAVFYHAADGPEAYPQYWAMIHYAARTLLHRPEMFTPSRHPAFLDPLVENAKRWLERADAAGLTEPVPADEQAAFRVCLGKLRKPRYAPPLGYQAQRLIFASLTATVSAWAGDRDLAERIPPHVYEAVRFHFDESGAWGLQFSQMLGHAPSAQEPLSPEDPTICLLNLASETAMGWMFGDIGNCSFWITPDALARLDFTKAWATIEGH